MTPKDLAATHARAFSASRAWTAQEFSSLLASPGVILSGDARSFLLGRVVMDEAEVLTLATNPADQRKGLARAVLGEFLQRAAQNGADRVFLEVAADNTAAKALYLREGFAEIGKRPNYYANSAGEKISALVLERRLDGAPRSSAD